MSLKLDFTTWSILAPLKSYRGYAKSYKACKLGCANYGIGLLVLPRLKQMIAWGYSKSSKGKRWYADEKGWEPLL